MHMRVCMSGWLVVTLFVSVVDGILVLGPEDSLAVRGSNVSLQCVTNRSEPVQWEVYKEPPIYWRLIYTGYPPKIPDYLKPKYYVTIDSTDNEYNLTIKNIQYEDSGTYRCIDYYGLAPKEEDLLAEVTVVEERISCSERICKVNETGCVLEEEVVDITCVMRYSGKRIPVLYWSLISSSDNNETQLHSYTTVSTGEWRSATLTSRLIINSTDIPHNSYIKCSLAPQDSLNRTFNNVDLDSIARVYWRSNLIEKTVKRRNTVLASVLISVSVTSMFLLIVICGVVLVIRKRRRPENLNENLNSTSVVEMKEIVPLLLDEGNVEVRGMTIADGKLFVVRATHTDQVKVYDYKNLTLIHDVNIPDLRDPQGLAVCSYNKALYISDVELKYIHIHLLGTTDKVTPLSIENNMEPLGLSLTTEGILLVTVRIRSTRYEKGIPVTDHNKSKILGYKNLRTKPYIEFEFEIDLHESIEGAWHTIQLSTDRFVVCHGEYLALVHRVCLVDGKCQILGSFDGQGIYGTNKESMLSRPCSLDIDKNRIVVASYFSRSIVILDHELRYVGQMDCKKDNFEYPSSLCLAPNYDDDDDTSILLVGDSKGSVFRLPIKPPGGGGPRLPDPL